MSERIRKMISVYAVTAALFALVIGILTAGHQIRLSRDAVNLFREEAGSLGNVLTNYLLGEQKVCDSYARYINENHLSLKDAVDFARASERKSGMVHIIFMDNASYSGLSTEAPVNNSGNFTVSYAHLKLLQNLSFDDFIEGQIHALGSFANPIDGKMSFGFYHPVNIWDALTRQTREAVLIRVVELSELEELLVLLEKSYPEARAALVTKEGDYSAKVKDFAGNNFIEEFLVYNPRLTEDALLKAVKGDFGAASVKNAEGKDCFVTEQAISLSDNHFLLTLIPRGAIQNAGFTVALLILSAAGIAALFGSGFMALRRMDKQVEAAEETKEKAIAGKGYLSRAIYSSLKAPLLSMVLKSSVAASEAGEEEKVRENLREIGEMGKSMAGLLSGMEEIYGEEGGPYTPGQSVFSLANTADDLTQIAAPYIRKKKLDFGFYVNRIEHELLIGDAPRIHKVMESVLLNALQYCHEGSRVEAELAEEVGSSAETVLLLYKVRDTGIGMDPDFLERVYEPFARGEEAHIFHPDGSGMGLSLAERIVRAMGGRMEIRSEKGKGTSVLVSLELRIEKENVESMVLPTRHALVLSSDDKLLNTAQETLYSLGIVADMASSAEEAMRLLKEEDAEGESYDLVILDRFMPAEDGFSCARRIRDTYRASSPKILIASYDFTGVDAEQAKLADGFVSEPFFRSKLYFVIAKTLSLDIPSIGDEEYFAGMHVLVAEDSEESYESMARMLGSFGISCERAKNGLEAVNRMVTLENPQPSLILMDVYMPVMNGPQAAEAIRNLPGVSREIPILAMTALTKEEDVRTYLQAGMNGLLVKPVRRGGLKEALKNVSKRQKEVRLPKGD